ncbi:MAG: DUF3276 family protein [Massilibacteroides sp.]|nr:DUF3276 family protein [Massilibacteroides sp.]MDD3062727.1 DUF3276 family protein [Massilibacteroides sp.]MDD4114157.1 DUF3276 family protein [Massilibacteroides sp.]MDD4660490.1 DUF3276 family protein [Massilibacteroides sp.]
MEDSMKKTYVESGDKEIIYSKAIKAGKRIYYLDVKKNLKDDLFLAITESKKVLAKDGVNVSFEKHKIFLYKEDFQKFMDGIADVISFIQTHKTTYMKENEISPDADNSNSQLGDDGDIKLKIEF